MMFLSFTVCKIQLVSMSFPVLLGEREKRLIVTVLVNSYSLHKHYDHILSITRVYIVRGYK